MLWHLSRAFSRVECGLVFVQHHKVLTNAVVREVFGHGLCGSVALTKVLGRTSMDGDS